jgi:Xaa-Pro dipeptidase
MLHFTHDEFATRLQKLTAKMHEQELDAMLLFAQESMFWLTGYDTFGFCFFQSLVVKSNGEMVLLTRSADLRQAQQTSIIDNIVIWKDSGNAEPVSDLKNLLINMGLADAKLGVEYNTHGLTAFYGRALDKGLSDFASLVDASDVVHGLRVIKSEAELSLVKRAAVLGDNALDAAIHSTLDGAFEGDILSAMHHANYSGGGDCPGNEFILGSGADALLCRCKTGRRHISTNDQLTIEWSGTYAHYHAAMMQTLVIGKPRPRHEELAVAAREALIAVEKTMVTGSSFGELYEAHANVMNGAGLSDHVLNACGYSLGARFAPSWMDGPMFYKDNPFLVAPNMVLFAHMIIFDSETETAMTLGRSYITTDAAALPLSRHDLDLIVL